MRCGKLRPVLRSSVHGSLSPHLVFLLCPWTRDPATGRASVFLGQSKPGLRGAPEPVPAVLAAAMQAAFLGQHKRQVRRDAAILAVMEGTVDTVLHGRNTAAMLEVNDEGAMVHDFSP